MDQLVDKTLREFTDLLASGEPTPGGGSSAAMTGAQGAALVAMVCALTAGRKKYEEYDALARRTRIGAMRVQAALLEAMDLDSRAYEGVVAVFAMPKETEGEKAARRAAMQQALKDSTLSPLRTMELALEGLTLAAEMCGKCNVNAASDLAVAALSLRTALEGGWANVRINLSGIEDAAFTGEYDEKGRRLLEQGRSLADEVARWAGSAIG